MPTTRKENLQFGMMMCLGMVIVMTFYNLLMNGSGGQIHIKEIALELLIGFIIALLVEICIVGPCAKKIVFMLPFDKSKKINIIVAMATTMVIGMVFFMSFFGMAMMHLHGGLQGDSFVSIYFTIFIKNFIMAYPLQLIIMGPLVRFLFAKFILKNKAVKVA
ncbi:DUF2798 domain-containing protein [Bacillus paranthracis]|uniref:DUF2798 domain-containing protein n=3 Tax=Bacillus cereus group TaxID=86661 RepID=A0A5M9H6G3_9BACI|nr:MULTISPECIES: hypothetical protein [Bacillus]ACJ77518.1 conserved hypothetical protein [Bacillus cereus AH187]EJQ00746.1 hypothetical protein IAU_00288 [Bacillus cereus IS075]EJQ07399.1 hypothetical protein IC5_01402 [Bacillus cereus AND1407]EJR16525.1 hypothetical protein II7_01902 [Bacillus cereus MSX-A12]EOO86662.1 hypothetical protein IGS_03972 [Bacillus cereus IS845/00]EOO95634.1 hypothetical protein IGQ_03728 [Bacillus cereus IS195]KFK74030.1 putative membrane protein [Bacillus cere